MKKTLPRRSTLLIALVIVVVDQVSKAWASSALQGGQSLPLLPGLLSLQLVHNTGAAFSMLQNSTALLGLLSFGVGMSPVPWAINSEIYPLRVRTVCVGIATAANWVTNFLVAATFLSLQDAVSKPGAFWLYGAFTVMGAIWLCLTMPETAGRSLEQIEVLFERPSRVIT